MQGDESQSAVEVEELPSLSGTPPPVLGENTQKREERQQVTKDQIRPVVFLFLNLPKKAKKKGLRGGENQNQPPCL